MSDILKDLVLHENGVEERELANELESLEKYNNYCDSLLIDQNHIYKKPPTILTVGGKTLLTKGNISGIIGAPKSKKSMELAILSAAVLKGAIQQIESQENNGKVLYFDTEQGKYHASLQTQRIINKSQKNGLLRYYCLREVNVSEILNIIENEVKRNNNISLVVIDGIADLVYSVNDEAECSRVIKKIMQLSTIYNTHITTVLHTSKGSNHAKGHLGSFLGQKAEVVLHLETDKANKSFSKVEAIFSRNDEIETYYIEVDNFGIPHISNNPPLAAANEKKKTSNPYDYDLEINYELAKEVYGEKEMKLSEAVQNIMLVLGKHNRPRSEKPAKTFNSYLLREKMIKQENPRGNYSLNTKWFYTGTNEEI